MKWLRIKKLKVSQKQIIFYISVLFLTVVAAPLFVIAHYGSMCADDYNFVMGAIDVWKSEHSVISLLSNRFSYAVNLYNSWQGTFSMEWLGSALMTVIVEDKYFLGAYLGIGSLIASQMLLFMLMGTKVLEADKYDTGIISCWLIAAQLLMIPYPVEAFYWLNATLLYTVGFSCTVTLCTLFFILLRGTGKIGKVLTEIAICFLIFIIAFGNFVSALFGFSSFILLMFYVWMKKHPSRILISADFVLYTVFLVLNIIAPGNKRRMDVAGTEDAGAVKAVIKSLLAAAQYVVTNLYPTVIILLLMMLPFMIGAVKKKAFSGKKTFRLPLLFSAVSFGLFASQFVPTMYSIGIIGAGRVINIYRHTVYILLFANLLYWTGWIMRRLYEEHPELDVNAKKKGKSCLWQAFVLEFILYCFAAYFYGGSTITTVSALNSLCSGQAARYREEYLERLEILQDDSIKDAYLKPYSDPPYLIHLDDIKEDPSNWLNGGLAAYYGKDSVRLIEDPEE